MARRRPSARTKLVAGRKDATSSRPVWIVLGFDSRTFEQYVPTPGVFLKEDDAHEFVSRFSVFGIFYCIRKTMTGSFDLKKRRRS